MTDLIIPDYCPPKPWLEVMPWFPVNAPLLGLPPRSPGVYRAVIDQFEVAATKRYQRTTKDTFCNIFAWDVTCAMGCEIPHWIDSLSGKPTKPGKGRELDADAVRQWLIMRGPDYGWDKCTQFDAQLAAEAGCPAVAVGLEHIAMIVPVSGQAGTFVTQAGAHNFADGPLERAWRAIDIPKLLFFTHA